MSKQPQGPADAASNPASQRPQVGLVPPTASYTLDVVLSSVLAAPRDPPQGRAPAKDPPASLVLSAPHPQTLSL